MRHNKIIIQLLLVSSVLFLVSCTITGGKSSRPAGTSSTTGWSYNDRQTGGFEYVPNVEQTTGPGLVLIQGGAFVMGRVADDIMYDWNNEPRKVTVPSFYIDQSEVQNIDYREYLHWLSRVYKSYPEVGKKALPDTLVWLSSLGFNDNYVNYYFRHPAYNNYPVVGVSWLQANDYCSWRTDRANEMILINKEILSIDDINQQTDDENFNTESYLLGQYTGTPGEYPIEDLSSEEGGTRQVRVSDGILLLNYRLPTEAEWEYAAYGYVSISERISNRKTYPWQEKNMRNSDTGVRGQMLANYVRGNGDMMGVAGALNDAGDITVPVISFWPNDYGLYCMSGNVNEWVMDVYRSKSNTVVDEFNPFRGNVFKTKLLDEEGNIAEKDSLGRIKYRNFTDEELALRINRNVATSDNINFLDGDVLSSVVNDQTWTNPEHNKLGTKRMYNSSNSLITDRTRVYKGGSWKDRSYWLQPATRRFLDERSARSDIGFRCAMTRVGTNNVPTDIVTK